MAHFYQKACKVISTPVLIVFFIYQYVYLLIPPASGVPSYFCTRGSPWQKPHVEGSIGLTRRWFLPKGTDLATVPEETLPSMFFVLNHKYRKSLGYKSAYEVSLERGIIKEIPKLSIERAVAFR